jgi:tRNA-dihydrouridine synthase
MQLILAPLHGFTELGFRNVYARHFHALDYAIAPFISLTHGDKITALKVKDVLPSRQAGLRVVPQILGNEADTFILLCDYLSNELGYEEVNWNLGCPIKGIVNKKRGSGMLPYPGLIHQLLSEILPNINLNLSVKLRLGWHSPEEFPAVAEVLNQFPLSSVTIHPRIGIQQYTGNVLLDDLDKCLPLIKHQVIYNGDIHSFDDFSGIHNRFPVFQSIMLGRGIFYNPFLPEMIRSHDPTLPPHSGNRFAAYYFDLEAEMKSHKHFWMSKMKEYWKYFSRLLSLTETDFAALMQCRDEIEWNQMVNKHIQHFAEKYS